MKVSLISTGEEILRGEVLDTNGSFAAQELDQLGFQIMRRYTCSDDLVDLCHTFSQAWSEADAVIVCGGLGPTLDDRSAEALATMLAVPLVVDQTVLTKLKRLFADHNYSFTPNQARQAQLPQGAAPIENRFGTACGIAYQEKNKHFFCLPGPPREFRPMLIQWVIPRLQQSQQAAHGLVRSTKVLKVFGRGEGWVANKLDDLEEQIEHLQLGYRAAMPEIHIKLRTARPTEAECQQVLAQATDLVKQRLGRAVFTDSDQTLPDLVVSLLARNKKTLSSAESCTGGLVAKLITDIPGASAVFSLSTVTYSNQSKVNLLGVPAEVIEKHGAVSKECALAMAQGVHKISGSDYAVAVTGIAGPNGGTADKPIGSVWFATCGPQGTQTKLRQFPKMERDFIRRLAAHTACDLIRQQLEKP